MGKGKEKTEKGGGNFTGMCGYFAPSNKKRQEVAESATGQSLRAKINSNDGKKEKGKKGGGEEDAGGSKIPGILFTEGGAERWPVACPMSMRRLTKKEQEGGRKEKGKISLQMRILKHGLVYTAGKMFGTTPRGR